MRHKYNLLDNKKVNGLAKSLNKKTKRKQKWAGLRESESPALGILINKVNHI